MAGYCSFEQVTKFNLTVNAPLISYAGDHTPHSSHSNSSGYGTQAFANRFKPYVDPLAYEDPNKVSGGYGSLGVSGYGIDPGLRYSGSRR